MSGYGSAYSELKLTIPRIILEGIILLTITMITDYYVHLAKKKEKFLENDLHP